MCRSLSVIFLLLTLSACQFFRPASPPPTDVDTEVLARAPTDQSSWISERGSYNEQRYSPSGLINEYNLNALELKWSLDLDGPTSQTPLTIDNTIYLAIPGRSLLAVDAETGTQVWKVTAGPRSSGALKHKQTKGGMAIWGGNVYVASSSGRLVAFDRRQGKRLWRSPVATQESQFFTSPPRLIAGSIVVSVGGKDEEGGYLAAYDADTGEEVWRYRAASLDLGNTEGEDHQAASLQFLAYDGEFDILYLAVWTRLGEGEARHSSCPRLVAIQAQNGEYLWELAEASSPVRLCSQHAVALADLSIDGRMRAVLIQSLGSSGLNLVDRITGQAVTVDSSAAFDILSDSVGVGGIDDVGADEEGGCQPEKSTAELPFSSSMAVDPINKLIFLGLESGNQADCGAALGHLLAWDPINRETRWRVTRSDLTTGLLATGGNLLFHAASSELVVYHSPSGEKRWAYPLESASPPISYQIDGQQHIAIVAYSSEAKPGVPQLMVFAIKDAATVPDPQGDD